MAFHSQMIKGLLEGCVLKILDKGPAYGYLVAEMLRDAGFTELNEGSVYPVLVRLEKRKLLTSSLEKSPLGPKRKYYALSSEGQRRLLEFEESWQEVRETVEGIMKGVTKDE